MSSSWGAHTWSETDSERGGECSSHKGTDLEEVRSLHTSLLIFEVLDLMQVPSAYALTVYHHSSLDDLMQFTCVQTATKALLSQIAHCDGHMFLILLWEYNHCFSLMLWKQRKKCAKAHSHFIKELLSPGPEKILQFFFIIATHSISPPK